MKLTKEEIKEMNLVKAIMNQYGGWENFLCILMDVADAEKNECLSEYLWQALEKGHWRSAS